MLLITVEHVWVSSAKIITCRMREYIAKVVVTETLVVTAMKFLLMLLVIRGCLLWNMLVT